MIDDPCNLMLRLKEATTELHDLAESHPFQSAMVKGKLSIHAYAAYLGELLAVHEPLERCLRSLADRPPFSRILRDEQYQSRNARSDLAFLESTPRDCSSSPLVRRIHDWFESEPVALLGCHYVLEGSKNGGRFIARAVRRAYDLPPRDGTRYLDPHGDEQPALWARFKQSMNAVEWSPGESAAMVESARATFADVIHALDRLARRFPTRGVPCRIATVLPATVAS